MIAVLIQIIVQGSIGGGFFQSAYYRALTGFTLKQAALSTIFSLLAGLPGAYFLGRCRFPGRGILKSLSTVPFVLPPILAVLGFVLVFGNAGMVNTLRRWIAGPEVLPWKMLYSLPAIVMAHVFYNFPLTLRIVGDAWSTLPPDPPRAAASLGANRFRAFISVDLPHLFPAVLTAATVTFLYCFMSFAIVLVLGGGPKLTTLEVEIFRIIKYQLDFGRGSMLAVGESTIAFLILAGYAVGERIVRRGLGAELGNLGHRPPKTITGWPRVLSLVYVIPTLLLVVAPLLSVVANSFLTRVSRNAAPQFSLTHWARLIGRTRGGFSVTVPAIGRTMALAVFVSAVTTITAAAMAWYTVWNRRLSRLAQGVIALPLGVSSVILGLGWLILLRHLPRGALARIVVLGAAHTVTALPLSYRIIAGRLRELPARVSQAARVSGANALQTLIRVEIPWARKAMITSAVFGFAISAGELNATMVLAPGNFTTVPLAVYRLISAYDFNGACALGTLLIAVCVASFVALDRYAEE